MASNSAPSFQKKRFKYDVFLSFRGEDTRKTFVDHLYRALDQKGIITYKDDEKIQQGERISEQLTRSIEHSRFYIIVFSKNYAASSWCLDELVKIMECQKTAEEQTAYPLFFDVEPTEVRHQSGSVGDAFAKLVAKHEKSSGMFSFFIERFTRKRKRTLEDEDMEKEADVGRWRNALKEAASLAGMELKNTFNGHEAKFIQQIVEKVSLKLHFFNSRVDGKLVGMESRVRNLVSYLELGFDDVRMIGIKGIGGGGKTTLARAVFYHISIHFEGKSFVENVKEVSKGSPSGLKELQKQVLYDVLNDQSIVVKSVFDGNIMMKKIMPSKKVLIVLDDVDDIEQLEALACELSWFKPGSRIIVTTRDKQVLVAHGVHSDNIYDVNLLSHEEAFCLFSRYAYMREIPNQVYEELSRKVVRYAAGLPLTIKVLGSYLCARSESEWLDAIERLKTIPLEKTLKRLELSYSGLENDQKEIFLDVVCILKGEMMDDAIRMLESCGFNGQIGLSVLQQKSLITISNTHHLRFHDHIEEMGWNIVRRLHPGEPSRHNRLWIKEEIEEILVNELGTEATRSIKMLNTHLHPCVIMNGLRNMTELRLLYVVDGYKKWKVDEVSQYLPDSLRSLCWSGYPFRSLPKTFKADKLVNLEMVGSNISELWEGGERKGLNKLRFLDLGSSKVSNLNLELIPNLETLCLQGCSVLLELHLPVQCPNLKSLDLNGCKVSNLNLGMTPHLEELYLEGCDETVELQLPGECPNKFLNLSGSKLSNLNLGMAPHLKELYLEGFNENVEFHLPTECLNLRLLCLSGSKLSTVNLEMAHHLEDLRLGGCNEIVELHLPVECPNLKFLDLSGSKLSNLDLGMAPHLKELHLRGCNEFVELHLPVEFPNLQFLDLSGSKLGNLDLEMAPHLETLYLEGCSCLHEIHAPVGCLKMVVNLNLSGCLRFEHFLVGKQHESATLILNAKSLDTCPLHPNNNLPKFQFICSYHEPLPSSSGNVEKLISFGLCRCTNLESFAVSICGLQHLRELSLEGGIPQVPKDLGQLECLEKLSLSMKSIKHLPDSICELKQLKYLNLQSCWLLEQLPKDLGKLACLEELQLIDCVQLRGIPNSICMMKCLKSLHLYRCTLVEKLPEEFGCLECLKTLYLDRTVINHLPQSIYQLKGLRIIGYTGFSYYLEHE